MLVRIKILIELYIHKDLSLLMWSVSQLFICLFVYSNSTKSKH